MFKGIGRVFKREMKQLLGRKRSIIIFFVIPLFFTILYGNIYLQKSIKHINLGVINHSPSQLSRTLVQGFEKSEAFTVSRYLEDEEEIAPLMAVGEIDAVLIIPKDFTRDIKKGKSATVFVGANGTNMTISNTAMTEATKIIGTVSAGITVAKYQAQGLNETLAYQNVEPISFRIRPWYNPTNNYSNFLLLGYVMAIVQQVTFYFTAISISEERKREERLEELLRCSDSAFSIILGKFLVYFFCGVFSWVTAFLLAINAFHIPMRGSYGLLMLISLAFFSCICALGMFISVASKNSLNATQYSMLMALPAFLFSGFTWPIEVMPKALQILAYIFPLTYFANNVRDIALLGVSFQIIQKDLLTLCFGTILFFLLTIIVFYYRVLKKACPELSAELKA